jgi:hypothetical protein
MMIGLSGTSKTGVLHHYYCCSHQRKRLCTKKAVHKDWIEKLVLEYAVALVHDEALLEFIAENTYQYYLEQNTDSAYTESLHAALAETNKAMNNLVKAMETGIFNETTKARMDELDNRKAELEASIADSQLKLDLGIKKEHILYFLHRFAESDFEDEEYQKRLIKTFINSVFVYDDKVVLTFNYSGDNRTITVMEIDAGLTAGVRLPRALVHQNA